MARPVKDLPPDRILTIIVAPAFENLANVPEQRIEVVGHGIAGAVQVPHHLVEVISETDELCINEPPEIAVRLALQSDSVIFVEKDGERVNGKSIMGLMMLAAGPGSKLTVSAQGQDAPQALAEIETLLKRKFDED